MAHAVRDFYKLHNQVHNKLSSSEDIGILAEDAAERFLIERGYKILDRNFRRTWGELDLVAQKGSTLIFVEVKANRSATAGFNPEVRANPEKMRKVVRTAQSYLLTKKFPAEQEWQVDVVTVTFREGSKIADVVHFKNIDVL